MKDDGWSLFGAKEKYARPRPPPPRCEVCNAPVRDGLRFCSGMSDCLKKGIGIMDVTTKLNAKTDVEYCHLGYARCENRDPAHAHIIGSVVNDPVNHPSHYKQGGIETIDVIEAWGLGFNLGNAVKYISRAGKKDPKKELEDLEKAEFYLKRQIATLRKKLER